VTRILVLATTTGYQTRSFGEAAERLGVELVFATDRCHQLEDPWQDGAIAIRPSDEEASVAAIVEAARARPIDGILAVGDRLTVVAASVARAFGLPGHPREAAAAARHKRLTRERLHAAGLNVPTFVSPGFPCVVKPVALSGSRGVIRADDPASLVSAIDRVRALLRSPDIRAERDPSHDDILVEEFIPGHEYAVEGVLHHGQFHVLAIFDKPDPLDGPFFEETIYVTPPELSPVEENAIVSGIVRAAAALALRHGPIHAECRVNARGVYVLEVAARPIGGLCARALRFVVDGGPSASVISLEELLLRHALGESPERWRRERPASAVMMIPIPRRGVLRGVAGVDDARDIEGIDDVRITAKMDQLLVPLPEGASYLGFLFARATSSAEAVGALREAHHALHFRVDPEVPVLTGSAMRYNPEHD